MTGSSRQSIDSGRVWRLVREQHGVVTHAQLLAAGLSRHGIAHRLARGRLHRVGRGVYAVGRPELPRLGWWTAKVLGCGDGAALSHGSAAALWGIGEEGDAVEVTIRTFSGRRQPGVRLHRRPKLAVESLTRRHGIPVTNAVETLIDIAPRLSRDELEQAVSEADARGVVGVAELRAALADHRGEPGVARLRKLIDARTFRRSRSWLERRFRPLAKRAGYPVPLTGQWLNGFEVDFYWPRLGLVVETDGGGFHRTPFQQNQDRRRDQAHTAAGLVQLRFTHSQIRYEPEHVVAMLVAAKRLLPAPGARASAA